MESFEDSDTFFSKLSNQVFSKVESEMKNSRSMNLDLHIECMNRIEAKHIMLLKYRINEILYKKYRHRQITSDLYDPHFMLKCKNILHINISCQ